MDDKLKKLAALDGKELTAYTTLDPFYKKPRKPRAKRVKTVTADEQETQQDSALENEFDFDEWATEYDSVCEADLHLSLMTQEQRKDLGYFECTDTDSDSEYGENRFNIKGKKIFLRSTILLAIRNVSEIRSEWRESFYRTDRCKENAPNRVTTKFVDLFNQLALKNIFAAHLRSCQESVIKGKLEKFTPLITTKSFNELYGGVKQHVIDQLEMSDSIMNEMKSIWSRARPYRALTDLASDFRRLRKLKMKQPASTLQDIQNIFAVKNEFEEFLDKSNVPVEVIEEATKRIGADKYGASLNFARLIDETNLSEEEPEPHPETANETVSTFTADEHFADEPIEPASTANTPDDAPNTPPDLSKKDIAKLHRAIKKALKHKLSK